MQLPAKAIAVERICSIKILTDSLKKQHIFYKVGMMFEPATNSAHALFLLHPVGRNIWGNISKEETEIIIFLHFSFD